MKSLTYIMLVFASSVFLFVSCEDVTDVDTGFDTPQLVVDAWLTNTIDSIQTIHLTWSQDYFDNRLPTGVDGAQVSIRCSDQWGNIEEYIFENKGNGHYTYQPSQGKGLGSIGNIAKLEINLDTSTYTGITVIGPAPPIDSISLQDGSGLPGATQGDVFAHLYARDFPGIGNAYWIKSYRNDTLLLKPLEMNIAFDSGIEAGSTVDGVTFLRPIRFGINALDKNNFPRPLHQGDIVKCEIHSISPLAFRWLQTVKMQLSNGDNGIFSLPIANAVGNITDQNEKPVLGFFNIAHVTTMEKTVE